MTTRTRWQFSHLRLSHQIILMLCTVLGPFGLMTYLYVTNANKDITFVQKEMQGLRYIKTLIPLLNLSDSVYSSPYGPESLAEAQRAAAELDAELKSGAASAVFFAAMRSSDKLTALDAGAAVFTKIADGSNLTLDPDLDSYYAMDTLVTRWPELIAAAAAVRERTASFAKTGDVGLLPFAEFVSSIARFERAAEAVRTSLSNGFEGNADGELRTNLTPSLRSLEEIARTVTSAADGVISAPVASTRQAKAAETAAGAERLIATSRFFADGTASELNRLLQKRLDGLQSDRAKKLGIEAGFLLLTLLSVVVIIRSINQPVKDLILTIGRFEIGDFQLQVPHTERRNELGEIARALYRFKEMGAHSALTKAAIETSGINVMITDVDEHVAFMSRGLRTLLSELEPEFRAADPTFAIDGLIGRHIDSFRANGNLTRRLLTETQEVRKVSYSVGGRSIHVDMTYIRDNVGQVIGHTLIWYDITANLEAEREIAELVAAAATGHFGLTLSLDGKSGAALEIAQGLNSIAAMINSATADFASALSAMARGELTQPVAGEYAGVFGTLKCAINDTVQRLATIIAAIQVNANGVAQAAEEIRNGANELAARTEEQAAALVETAATTEELTASVKTSSTAAHHAAARAREAMDLARNGWSIAEDAVNAISQIEATSGRITDITAVIDQIAFQTNLLALNAAVEAARAGDAGRGFAVVASEVRSLAQRSSAAAKDIGALLNASGREVSEGVQLVKAAGGALDDIMKASSTLADLVASIAEASAEQATGIHEVSQTMEHIDSTTQRNAALAEESLAAATELSGQTAQLRQLVAGFRIAQAPASPEQAQSVTTLPVRQLQRVV